MTAPVPIPSVDSIPVGVHEELQTTASAVGDLLMAVAVSELEVRPATLSWLGARLLEASGEWDEVR
ncbi:MAG: hypothetical protein WCJ64_08500 [Rhodospirillaceae bacterium]